MAERVRTESVAGKTPLPCQVRDHRQGGSMVDGRCVRAIDGALDRTALGVHAIGRDARGPIDQGVHSPSAVGRSVDRADQRVDGHVVGPVDRDESVSDRSSLPLPSSDECWRGDYSVLLDVIIINYEDDVAAFSCCTCSREARSERRQNSPPRRQLRSPHHQ